MTDGQTTSLVPWARRVNRRWIVRSGLERRAEAYLDHLASVDPGRLERSCQLAYNLARRARAEDPKPWFYAGLFSLASVDEARKFLATHWFTVASIPSLPTEICAAAPVEALGQPAREKIQRIRQALEALLASPPTILSEQG